MSSNSVSPSRRESFAQQRGLFLDSRAFPRITRTEVSGSALARNFVGHDIVARFVGLSGHNSSDQQTLAGGAGGVVVLEDKNKAISDKLRERVKSVANDIYNAEHLLLNELPTQAVWDAELMRILVSRAPRLVNYVPAKVLARNPSILELARKQNRNVKVKPDLLAEMENEAEKMRQNPMERQHGPPPQKKKTRNLLA